MPTATNFEMFYPLHNAFYAEEGIIFLQHQLIVQFKSFSDPTEIQPELT